MKFKLTPLINSDIENLETVKHVVIEDPEVDHGFFCKKLFEDDRNTWARLPLGVPVYNPSTFFLMAEILNLTEKSVTEFILKDVVAFDQYCISLSDPVCFSKFKLYNWPVTPKAMRSEQATTKSKNDRTNSYLQMMRCNHWSELHPKDYVKQRRMMQRLVYADTWGKLDNPRNPASVIHRLSKKRGLLRGSMAGKRVDFSGRSAIVPDPLLPIDQAGIPHKMVMELLRPFLISEMYKKWGRNKGWAKYQIKTDSESARMALENIVGDHFLIINRAPSLHRYSLQLSRIRIDWDSKVLRLNPLIFSPLNADSDGDTVSINLILSDQAKGDAINKMSVHQNQMSSSDGMPIYNPAHESIVGLYARTLNYETDIKCREFVRSLNKLIGFNIDKSLLPLNKKNLGQLIYDLIIFYESTEEGRKRSSEIINSLNRIGYEESTKIGLTLGMNDFNVD